jgi:hypothetical protein
MMVGKRSRSKSMLVERWAVKSTRARAKAATDGATTNCTTTEKPAASAHGCAAEVLDKKSQHQ